MQNFGKHKIVYLWIAWKKNLNIQGKFNIRISQSNSRINKFSSHADRYVMYISQVKDDKTKSKKIEFFLISCCCSNGCGGGNGGCVCLRTGGRKKGTKTDFKIIFYSNSQRMRLSFFYFTVLKKIQIKRFSLFSSMEEKIRNFFRSRGTYQDTTH